MFINEFTTGYDGKWIDAALPLKIIGPTLSSYELQVINDVGIIKWHLCLWIQNPI